MKHVSRSPDETMEIARRMGAILEPGTIVCLYGELGSGKTVFVKGVCSGLGVEDEVTSPSFVIATEYYGRMPVSHIDLYRLDARAAADFHPEEYIMKSGVTMVEWAERLNIQDEACICVTFTVIGPTTREIIIENLGH
ncbi:tRNA (adenosine(37)-N6)-threonylcarbamoyltransferase complex ATPase subunit type 1 TsaE [candidate division WOR-3 bacterium]|nr:tRNA (adenosine(37)-N6)-threonylcarbamoyltransferase complex ATPase subunit type 1 TsaE [candidate division WOR-3 bacterium]